MSLTSLILRFAAPVPKVESFKRYLFVGPHPDDIEIGAGATAARLAAEGKEIAFLICTDGRFGDEFAAVSGDALAALRREEALRSAAMLGVKDVRFLDLCDGGFYSEDALLRAMAKAVGDFQPDVLLAPDPAAKSEGHADHLNVGRAVQRLAQCASNPGVMERLSAKAAPVKAAAFYMTASPNRYVGTAGYLRRQLEAIFSCHVSQFPPGSPGAKDIALYLRIRAADFGLRSLKGQAEGFRVLGALHMHCMPEAR